MHAHIALPDFAAALAQTPAGGEIDVLDPGDFGPVTITKSVSIYGDAPGVAGPIPSPGTSGIVSAPARATSSTCTAWCSMAPRPALPASCSPAARA